MKREISIKKATTFHIYNEKNCLNEDEDGDLRVCFAQFCEQNKDATLEMYKEYIAS